MLGFCCSCIGGNTTDAITLEASCRWMSRSMPMCATARLSYCDSIGHPHLANAQSNVVHKPRMMMRHAACGKVLDTHVCQAGPQHNYRVPPGFNGRCAAANSAANSANSQKRAGRLSQVNAGPATRADPGRRAISQHPKNAHIRSNRDSCADR